MIEQTCPNCGNKTKTLMRAEYCEPERIKTNGKKSGVCEPCYRSGIGLHIEDISQKERIAALEALVRHLAARFTPQPMETAPKDDSILIISVDEMNIEAIWNAEKEDRYKFDPDWQKITDMSTDEIEEILLDVASGSKTDE